MGLLGLAGLLARSQQAEMESYQRVQSLILRSCRYITINGKVTQEPLDFRFAHHFRMSAITKANITEYPLDVILFSAVRIVVKTECFSDLVHQSTELKQSFNGLLNT